MATTCEVSIDCLLLTSTIAQMSPEDITAFMRPIAVKKPRAKMTEDAFEHPLLAPAAGLQDVLANQAAAETLSAADVEADKLKRRRARNTATQRRCRQRRREREAEERLEGELVPPGLRLLL